MGTFFGHFLPGLSLALLGLWHVINTIKSHCLIKSSSSSDEDFRVRFWFPFPKSKHLELVSILVSSILAIALLTLDFPSFTFQFKPENLEHASMFLHLAIFAGFTLSCELTLCSDTFSGLIGALVASLFAQELFLLHFHSTQHSGLEGHYHFLLQLVVLASFSSALASILRPRSFSAALFLSVSVLFQGCWFLNMGFMLWDPRFVPRGCVNNAEIAHGAVSCESTEAEVRAKAVANLQFSWVLSGILICTCALCLKFSSNVDLRNKLKSSSSSSSEYERLCRRGRDCSVAVQAVTCKEQV